MPPRCQEVFINEAATCDSIFRSKKQRLQDMKSSRELKHLLIRITVVFSNNSYRMRTRNSSDVPLVTTTMPMTKVHLILGFAVFYLIQILATLLQSSYKFSHHHLLLQSDLHPYPQLALVHQHDPHHHLLHVLRHLLDECICQSHPLSVLPNTSA